MIVGAQITKQQRAAKSPAYGVMVHLFKGDPVRFFCRSRQMAIAVHNALHTQLPVEMRSSARCLPEEAVQDNFGIGSAQQTAARS
jgi:hypothetical protein